VKVVVFSHATTIDLDREEDVAIKGEGIKEERDVVEGDI
jgi:hypothetical protein